MLHMYIYIYMYVYIHTCIYIPDGITYLISHHRTFFFTSSGDLVAFGHLRETNKIPWPLAPSSVRVTWVDGGDPNFPSLGLEFPWCRGNNRIQRERIYE